MAKACNFHAKVRNIPVVRYLCGDETRNRTLFGTRPTAGTPRRGCGLAQGHRPRLRGQRLVHAVRGAPCRPGPGDGDAHRGAPPRVACGLSAPRCTGAQRTGHHGREHPSRRVLRPAVRRGGGPPLPGQALGQGPRADGAHRRAAARHRSQGAGRPLRRHAAGRCRDRHGQRQCQPLLPRAIRRNPRPAARQPAVRRRAVGPRNARTAPRTGGRHLGLLGTGMPQRVAPVPARRI